MRILLTGFMGAGKTTVGRALARRLALEFVDLDEEIERRAGAPVREVFARDGEPRFREIERAALAEALARDDLVIATGGGTLAAPANARAARAASGLVVWLHPAFATIMRRIGGRGKRDRPLLRDEESALALYRERLEAYRAAADLEVAVSPSEQAEEVAARISLLVRERACAI